MIDCDCGGGVDAVYGNLDIEVDGDGNGGDGCLSR